MSYVGSVGVVVGEKTRLHFLTSCKGVLSVYRLIATIEIPISIDRRFKSCPRSPISEGDCFRRQAVALPAPVLASPWPERR
jgi:hypothetical protein